MREPFAGGAMRVAVIGRTETLLATAESLRSDGHEIALVVTAREAPDYQATSQDFADAASRWGVPFVHTPRMAEVEPLLDRLAPIDVGVSINYPGVLSAATISRFRHGVLNAHGGDLPRYRGNACQAWAIVNGEDRIGLCVHRMVGGELDSGDIIARDYLPITLETPIGVVHRWMADRTPCLFLDALRALQANAGFVLQSQSTNPADALRCYPRRPEDGRLDWSRDAVSLLRLVNESGWPYAGAFAFSGDRKVTVWAATLAPPESFCAVPGQVTAITPTYLDVATGQGKLRLTELSVDGAPVAPNALVTSLRARLT